MEIEFIWDASGGYIIKIDRMYINLSLGPISSEDKAKTKIVNYLYKEEGIIFDGDKISFSR